MRKIAIILAICILAAAAASAQSTAVIRDVTGKVEIQAPQAGWVSARVGMTVSRGTTISTGFNSRALLDLGSSVLSVQPLTRLRLEELLEKKGTVQTDLFLRVGKVNAQVKSTAGVTQDFKLRSPVSTAAVRGTGLEYDGYDVAVQEGMVYYFNLLNQGRSYGPGEGGGSDGYGSPQSGDQSKDENSSVNPYTPGAGGERQSGFGGVTDSYLTGGISIIIPPILLE